MSSELPACPECGHWLERAREIADDRYELSGKIVAAGILLGLLLGWLHGAATGVAIFAILVLPAAVANEIGRPKWYCFGCRRHWHAQQVKRR